MDRSHHATGMRMPSTPDSPLPSPPPPSYESSHGDPRIRLSTSSNTSQPSPCQSRNNPLPPPPPSPCQAQSHNNISPLSSPTSPQGKPPSLPLVMPTKKYPLSSGFPYRSSIFHLGVSPDDWKLFSDDIVQATKLSLPKQSLVWTSGIGVGLVSVATLPPFGAAAGVFAGKVVYDKSVLTKVKNGLMEGKLESVMKRWNEDFWAHKGLAVEFVVKQNKQGANGDHKGQKKKDKKKDQQREAGRFELVIDSVAAMPKTADNDRHTYCSNTIIMEIMDNDETYNEPVELASPTLNRSNTPQELPMTPAPIVNEKKALAHKARDSWESAHPLERPPLPTYVLVDDNFGKIARSTSNDSASDDARESWVSSEMEDSPIVEADDGLIPYDLRHATIDPSLAPAPLFSTKR